MKKNLLASLEAILFINGEAVTFSTLQKILEVEKEVLQKTLKEYQALLHEREGGLVLVTDAKSARLAIAPDYVPLIEELAKSELQSTLSKAALEVLALVSYLAPVARAEIDAIRGVNSSFTLRNLAIRGLIERSGNPNDARGYVYEPSMQFLTTLGIEAIHNLPGFEAIRADERLRVLQGKGSLEEEKNSTE